MRLRSYLIALAAIIIPTVVSAVNKETKVFMYGVVTSFNDSTVYFTDIQMLDSAWVDSKTGFLYSRENYSYQLRDNMHKLGIAHPTCITVFSKTRKDIEKKYFAMKKRYTSKGRYDVKYLTASDFQFEAVVPDESERKDKATLKKEAKQEKAELKQEKEQLKKQKKQDKTELKQSYKQQKLNKKEEKEGKKKENNA